MPFVKEKFIVEEKSLAFLFVMSALNYTQGQAQRHIAKGRLIIRRCVYDLYRCYYRGRCRDGLPFAPKEKVCVPPSRTMTSCSLKNLSGVLVHPNTMATPYSMLDEVRSLAGDNANSTHRIDMETSGLTSLFQT